MRECDGGGSFLGTRCHIPFLGKELSQHFVLADLKIKSELPSNQVYAFMSDNGPLLLIQFDQNYSRLIAEVTHDPELSAAKSVTDEQLKRLVRERSPFKLELEKPVWTSGFWIHERIVSSYRHNNIFFAGDTAHIHSPAGGQGMNTGIQDVYNLAWKLALVINKKAPSTLLDSYHIEREQVGKSVLKKTTLLTWMISLHHPVLSFIRNWILSHVMRFEKIRKKIAEDMTQLAIHYKNSSVIEDHLKTCLGPPPGMRMLDVSYDTHTTLFNLVRGPTHHLIFFSGKNSELNTIIQLKNSLKHRYPGLIKFILISKENNFSGWDEEKMFDEHELVHTCYGVKKAMLYLIRPDKYISFRGKIEDTDVFKTYLQKLFV